MVIYIYVYIPSFFFQLSTTSTYKEPPKREIKLKLFVSSLFIVIVTVVTVVLHFAHLQEYRVELGKRIIVHEDTRKIHLTDDKRPDALVGEFGLGLPRGVLPHDCSNDKTRKTHLCLKWKDKALLNIDYWEDKSANSKCYSIGWKSLHPDTVLKDCYKLDSGLVHWFGGSLKENQRWPLMNTTIPLLPYITGELGDDEAFGPVIERYWLSSKAVAIFSTNLSSPLHVSWNAFDQSDVNATEGDDRLCLVAKGDDQIYGKSSKELVELNYDVCLGSDILDVHQVALEKISTQRNISEIVHPNLDLFQKPSVSIYTALGGSVNQNSVLKLGERLRNKSVDVGLLHIDNGWQLHSGDLQFDRSRFPNVSSMMATLREMNYTVVLGISPYVSIHSKNFISCADKELFVRDGGGRTPGVFKANLGDSGNQSSNLYAALDITYPSPKIWLAEWKEQLGETTGVQYFSSQGGMTTFLPFTSKFSNDSNDPNLYTYNYGTWALQDTKLTILDSATNAQGQPVVIRLNISDLQVVLPLVLTLGIMGYPYVIPEMHLAPLGTRPSRDLYIRSVQLAAFLPIMHLSHLPDEYDDVTISIVKDFIQRHRKLVHTRVRNHGNRSSLIDPVIKPLWWIDPKDPKTMERDTEFIVGDDLLVAPILTESTWSRDVYLPKGKWFDPRLNKSISGPELLKDYHVPLNQTAYFFKR